MRTIVVGVAFSFVHVCESVRTNGEREREKEHDGGQSRSLCQTRFRGQHARRALVREREREREREKEIARKCIISNDYLVVVLVADDRSQSRDFAQSQDDKEAETITIPRRRRRRRPHRPPPRCFGAGLLRNREGERHREMCKVCRDHTPSFGSLSPSRV